MTLSNAIILIVTLLYGGVTVAAIAERNYGRAVVFGGYTLANVGFILFD